MIRFKVASYGLDVLGHHVADYLNAHAAADHMLGDCLLGDYVADGYAVDSPISLTHAAEDI